jgi:hypothetical protein
MQQSKGWKWDPECQIMIKQSQKRINRKCLASNGWLFSSSKNSEAAKIRIVLVVLFFCFLTYKIEALLIVFMNILVPILCRYEFWGRRFRDHQVWLLLFSIRKKYSLVWRKVNKRRSNTVQFLFFARSVDISSVSRQLLKLSSCWAWTVFECLNLLQEKCMNQLGLRTTRDLSVRRPFLPIHEIVPPPSVAFSTKNVNDTPETRFWPGPGKGFVFLSPWESSHTRHPAKPSKQTWIQIYRSVIIPGRWGRKSCHF